MKYFLLFYNSLCLNENCLDMLYHTITMRRHMMWTQVYNPTGNAVLSALLAAIPLFALFYMLAVRRSKGHYAAAVAVVLSAITAVWVYNMTVESGEFEYLKQSLANLTDDRRLQAIFIAFAFGAFLEGTAGFGTPVAITAAMLVGLGFKPLYAAGVCLIANTAPVAFGAIGVPIIVAGQVSGVSDMTISAIVGRQLPFLSIIVPLWLCVLMCGFKRSMEVLPAIAVAGVCFAGSQFLFSNPARHHVGSDYHYRPGRAAARVEARYHLAA